MSKLFVAVNDFDSHKKSRHYDLALEKFWVTQCGWLRLCMKVAMVMAITNVGNCFCWGPSVS